MSTDTEEPEKPDEAPEEGAEAPDSEEQPDLDDEDLVEIDPEMAEAVADEGDESDGSESEGDDSDTSAESETSDTTTTLTTGTSAGDIYCNALGMGAAVARESKGSGVEDREAAIEEYGDLARQLDLDDFVNEWIREHGGADELTPGQGLAVGTAMFAMAVMVEDPAIVENMGGSQEGET